VNRWLRDALAPLPKVPAGLVLVLDLDAVIDPGELSGEVEVVRDWWGLRARYERASRRRPAGAERLALLVAGPLATQPLPWDIERAASEIIAVRLPGPPSVRAVLRLLSGDEADRAIRAASASPEPAAAMLAVLTGVAVVGGSMERADQLRLAARVAARADWPPALGELARSWVTEPALSGLLGRPPESTRLQQEWERFCSGEPTPWSSTFDGARLETAQLFAAGVLQPVTTQATLPAWAAVGIRSQSDEERAEELLQDPPVALPPVEAEQWGLVAQWWGQIRALVATAPEPLRSRAWTAWEELDRAFFPWLRGNYGLLLSSASSWPSAVHRIAPFLARRLREGTAERVMLVVLDGLGYTQWAHLRDRLQCKEVESGAVFAMLPTYTTVSRQAIFAGRLPATYPDTLWTTSRERQRWEDFWATEGIPVTSVAYHRVNGRFPLDHIDFGISRAIGVVVNAVDDLMHSSELFGDAQLLANLDVWVQNAFLDDLVNRSDAAGIETWITADHGNIECLGTGRPGQGDLIEAAGKRLLRFPNQVLRDSSGVRGIVWNAIPGLPNDAAALLIAASRAAYTNQRLSVSHGGLSLDEVVIPLARVRA